MSGSNTLLDDLTAPQRAAATQGGAVLVLAGAGTGKTKTLTRAVTHRIEARSMPSAFIDDIPECHRVHGWLRSPSRAGGIGRQIVQALGPGTLSRLGRLA